jgi:DNA-binding NtrC family response regulator
MATIDTKTILLVEDDPGLRTLLEMELEECGYRVLPFASAEQALHATPERPAVAVLDYRLPGLSGLALLKRLRSRHARLPALIITSEQDVQDDPDWPQTPETFLLRKPFRRERFIAALTHTLTGA